MLGSGMGGGLGKYMGYYGLVLDNIIDFTVVIADGSILHVSASSHSDLYWAMRGAGHNFGIVTQFTMKIYDSPSVNWYQASYTFTKDKLVPFIEEVNRVNALGTQPKELGEVYTLMTMMPEVSAEVRWPSSHEQNLSLIISAASILCERILRRHRSRSPPLLPTIPRHRTRRHHKRLNRVHRHPRRSGHRSRRTCLRRRLKSAALPSRSSLLQRLDRREGL